MEEPDDSVLHQNLPVGGGAKPDGHEEDDDVNNNDVDVDADNDVLHKNLTVKRTKPDDYHVSHLLLGFECQKPK